MDNDGSEPIIVTLTTADTVPADDPGVTVTFTADDYEDVTRMFTIVETGNEGVTDVVVTQGTGLIGETTATVSWTLPDNTVERLGYRVTSKP